MTSSLPSARPLRPWAALALALACLSGCAPGDGAAPALGEVWELPPAPARPAPVQLASAAR